MHTEKAAIEAKRLEKLYSYEILDTAPDASFDRITRLAQATLQTPIAMISLIDANRQWIKSAQGLDLREAPRSVSFCSHVIESNEPMVVADTREDQRFRDNPLVVGEPHIRFYAGVPLTASGGLRLGTLCAIDRKPRDVSERQISLLQDLARLTIDEIEFRKMALSDSLTGLCTRRAFAAEASRQVAAAKRTARALGCVMFDIDHFSQLNEKHSHAAGDLVLQAIADVCRREMRKIDVAGRVGSEEFGVLLPETGIEGAMRAAERLRQAIETAVVDYACNSVNVTASFGISALGATEDNATGLLKRAEQALHEAKSCGRNRTAILAPADDQLEAPPRARIAVRR